MKTRAVRMYGKFDLRLEEFELPDITDDEILAHIISDSLCMSSYKAASQGEDHKRVPKNIAENPIILGHEFCGVIVEVGEKWRDQFKPGQKFSIQPAFNYKGSLAAPGYSYKYCGGNATYVIIPPEAMLTGSLLPYEGESFYKGSLAEPMSCIVGTFHAMYHTQNGKYDHEMGIREGGNMAILAGVGPMGLGAVDYAINCGRRPSLLVVTDIDEGRLERARKLYSAEDAAKNGVTLKYINTAIDDPVTALLEASNGEGYDDVMVFAPVRQLVEQGDAILRRDGCLNFFAGPSDPKFSAMFNFYDVHYASTHIVGTSGGNTDDMIESLDMMSKGTLNPSSMISHIGGLDSVIETTKKLPDIRAGKMLIYVNIDMPLTAISDFEKLGENDILFKNLAEIVNRNGGLWCDEAEKYLLSNK